MTKAYEFNWVARQVDVDRLNLNPLVIHHGGSCRDGFCSAWIAHCWFQAVGLPQPEFFPAQYGDRPPDWLFNEPRDVLMVDFSYPRPIMEMLASKCRNMIVLDHHKTAEAELRGFNSLGSNVSINFDMEKSGAGLAWQWLFSGPPPWIVAYVEDRDLWRKVLSNSEQINAYIGTLPLDFDAWSEAYAKFTLFSAAKEHMLDFPAPEVYGAGAAVVAKTEHYVREVSKNAHLVVFEGYSVPLVNAPQIDISELVHALAARPWRDFRVPKFAMGWWQRSDQRYQYSLRSVGDFDVSALARKYRGGGHKNAAGFESFDPLHQSWPNPLVVSDEQHWKDVWKDG